MIKTLAAVALAAAVATPAFAASARHHVRAQTNDNGYSAYASAPSSTVVIENGQYAGEDPDPNVRLSLRQQANELSAE